MPIFDNIEAMTLITSSFNPKKTMEFLPTISNHFKRKRSENLSVKNLAINNNTSVTTIAATKKTKPLSPYVSVLMLT